ncbi:MAG: hypothetical protein ACOH2H_12835 [Cypionkella sp.]
MTRPLRHLLTCLLLSLTLALAGATTAAARLSMAAEADLLTEVVVCAEGGAHVVTLNAAGKPVAHKSTGSCTHCPECWQATAFALPDPARSDLTSEHPSKAEPSPSLPHFTLTRATGPLQARAPPKEL